MKKVLSIIVTLSLLFTLTTYSSAYQNDPDNYTLENAAIEKIKNELEENEDLSITQKAEMLLTECGMDSQIVKGISDNMKAKIYNECNGFGMKTEYCVENSNGYVSHIQKSEYLDEKNTINANIFSNFGISPMNNTVTDKYFKKSTSYIAGKGGYYALFVMFEWLKAPLIRATDGLVLSASSGAFESGSSGAIFTYDQVTTKSNKVTTQHKEFTYDETSKNYTGNSNVVYSFKLPADAPGTNLSVVNINIKTCVLSGFNVEHPTLKTNFTFYGNYFHRIIALGSSISISGSGPSISISPSTSFKQYTIPESITYKPN